MSTLVPAPAMKSFRSSPVVTSARVVCPASRAVPIAIQLQYPVRGRRAPSSSVVAGALRRRRSPARAHGARP